MVAQRTVDVLQSKGSCDSVDNASGALNLLVGVLLALGAPLGGVENLRNHLCGQGPLRARCTAGKALCEQGPLRVDRNRLRAARRSSFFCAVRVNNYTIHASTCRATDHRAETSGSSQISGSNLRTVGLLAVWEIIRKKGYQCIALCRD